MKSTIYIVDDEEAVRDALQLLLETAGFSNVVCYGSSQKFRDEIEARPGDILILDVRMPEIDGLELLTQLAQRGLKLPVIVMTGHGDVPIAVRAMKAGAVDFIEKPFEEDLMIESVQRAIALGAASKDSDGESRQAREHYEALTPREREVMDGMVAGHPNKVIAYELGISPRTVEIHRARVMEKMSAANLSTLVRLALAAKLGPTG